MKSKKILNIKQSLIGIFVISVITTLLSIAIQPGVFLTSLINILCRPLTVVLNGFPVLVFVFIGYLLTNNVFWGASVPSLFMLLLSYINLLKIEGRNDVFVPSDIGLFREAMTAASDYNLNMHFELVILMIGYFILLIILGCYIKAEKIVFIKRSIISVVTILLFLLSMKYVYSSSELFYSFPVAGTYNIPLRFNTLGFNYCFLHNFNLYPVDKPDGYNKNEVVSWEEEYLSEKKDVSVTPNVIMIMCEAFSDLSNESVFLWESEEDNPIYKYNLLAQSDQAISGHIIVSNISAGTANTEFDILTGMPTNMIGDGTTSSFRVVNREMTTVPSVLKANGYSTSFLHPGDSWFYNRSNVYKFFGIENQVFNERFDLEKDIWGSYVSDEAFLRELKVELDDAEAPHFLYGVTIQNHQTYKYEKYPDETESVPVDVELSDDAMEYLSVYMRGVEDSADMLCELVEYIDALEEPTVLVFFGDHLPNLGEDCLTYSELGLPVGNTDTVENILSAYTTPFMIYGNTAYCGVVDLEEKAEELELPESGVINNMYLGSTVLELLGYTGEDAYFDFLNYARRVLPVFREKEHSYMLIDGTYTDNISDEMYEDIIRKVDLWEYYRLRDN